MRTTLTLDDDVAKEIERLRAERRTGLKETINAVLRAGVAALRSRKRAPTKAAFRTEAVSLGTPRLKSLDDIDEVLSLGEVKTTGDPRRRESPSVCDRLGLRRAHRRA